MFFRAPSVPGALGMLAGMAGLHGVGPGFPLPERLMAHTGRPARCCMARGLIEVARWQDTLHALVAIGGMVGLYLIVWLLPNTQQIFADASPALDAVEQGPIAWLRWRATLPWAVAFGCATVMGLLAVGGTGEFLYFQF